jgi:hypothetical protein
MVSVTPSTHCTGGTVGLRAGLDTKDTGEILCPCQGSNPDRPVHSQTLYWLSYLAHLSYNYMLEFIYRNHNKLLESCSTDGIFSLQFCFQKTMVQYIITYVHRHWEWNNLNHSERKICGVTFLCTWVENSQPGYYVVLSHLGLSAV